MKKYIVMLAVALVALCSCEHSNTDDTGSAVRLFGAVPESAYAGEQVSLWGDGFGDAVTSVTIGGVEATIVEVTGESVVITIPAGAQSGKIVVTAAAGSATLDNFRVLTEAQIIDFSPAVVTYEGKVEIYGHGFDLDNIYGNTVTVLSDDEESPPLRILGGGFSKEMQMDSLQVFVENPFSNTGGAHLRIKVGPSYALATGTIAFKGDPRIDDLYPRRGGAGTVITIEGMNFVTGDIAQNTVTCGSHVLEVVAVESRAKMKVKLPDGPYADGFGLEGKITVAVPTGETPAISDKTFRYDPAADYSFGEYGIVYAQANATAVDVTQAYVDEMLAMGVKYVVFRLRLNDNTVGLPTGTLPANANQVRGVPSAIRAKQMSSGKLKIILMVDQADATLGSATATQTFFDNIKAYEIAAYPGVKAWDCIDAFQILYNANSFSNVTVQDIMESYYKPVWEYIHPNGYPCKGEKLIIAFSPIQNGNNFLFSNIDGANGVKESRMMEYIDIFNAQWNYGGASGTTSDPNFSRTCPENGFYSTFNSFLGGVANNFIIDGYPVCFMTTECNLNAANAKFHSTTSLQASFIYLINEMKQIQGFKGWTYRSFLEDDVGVHQAAGGTADPYTGIKATPTHEQMYKNIVTGTGGSL